MCGRFTLTVPSDYLIDHFALDDAPTLPFRYNIAPTQSIAVVRQVADGRELVSMRWGLVPHWAKDPSTGAKHINARAETVGEKPSFRDAFRKRRCLIPATGFFEWKKAGTRKQPYLFRVGDGDLFAFAGLWELWTNGDPAIESCTILTTEANKLVKPYHERMPVILRPEDYEAWLAKGGVDLLRPFPAERMTTVAVNSVVNNARNDVPECVQPV